MKIKKTLFSIAFLFSVANEAMAEGCVVKNGLLDCGSNEAEAVVKALVDPKTKLLFQTPTLYKSVFNDQPYKRELFRRSLEEARIKVENYYSAIRRAYDRNELSQAEFDDHTIRYNQAIVAYGEGYWFYKNLRWQSD